MDKNIVKIILLSLLLGGCIKNGNNSGGAVNEGIISGCELTITCKAGVNEELNVSVVSGKHTEDFGVIGALPERDGGKTVGFSPMRFDREVTIKWGIEGQDFLEQTNSYTFDLTAFHPYVCIALDEAREEFRQLEVQGAEPVGFAGKHSDDGGGYGPGNKFSWITRGFMVNRAKKAGIKFQNSILGGYNTFPFTAKDVYDAFPTHNDTWYFNDNEIRKFPRDMKLHYSIRWFKQDPSTWFMQPYKKIDPNGCMQYLYPFLLPGTSNS